jgi:hypothetical protein
VGLSAVPGWFYHVESFGENRATAPGVVPFLDLDSHVRNLEIHAEWTGPLPPINIGSGSTGIQSIKLSYFDAAARYWIVPNRIAFGAGQLLWNQQTRYNDVMPTATEFDASRGAGMRYEVLGNLPWRGGYFQAAVAAMPRIHALLSWTFDPGTIVRTPTSEQEAQVDSSLTYYFAQHDRTQFSMGLRYLNMTAKFNDGSFADANRVIGVSFKESYFVPLP